MNKKQLAKIEQKLKKEKKELEKALKAIATKDKKLAGDFDARFKDFGDEVYDNSVEAAEVSEYDVRLSLEANLEVRLLETNRALDQIKKGTYGICTKCKGKIEDTRLEAFPQAKLCITCSPKKKKRGIYYG